MSNIIIAAPTLSDAATLYESSETTAGPASNLQGMQKSDVWEMSGTNQSIDIDLGSSLSLNFFGLLFTDLLTTGTVTIDTAATQGGLGSPVYTSGAVSPVTAGDYTHLVHVPSVAVTNRWVRFTMASTGSDNTVGRLYVSDGYRPSVNFRYGYQDGFDDTATIDVTDGGSLIPGSSMNRQLLNLSLLSLTEAERHTLRELMRTQAATGDVCVVTDPDAGSNLGDHIICGLLQARRITIQTHFNRHETSLQVTGL